MPYEPTEWVRGTKITASKLNNIESGVQSVNSEYTPTTWAEGDIVTATKLNNIEQGIANASGGGGDFSVAEVTVGEGVDGQLLGVIDDPSESWDLPQGTLPSVIDGTESISGKINNVCLYNGHTLFYAYSSVAVTGNITLLTTAYDTSIYDITGDCTITIP